MVHPVRIPAYVPHDLPVVCLTDGQKDGLSIGMVDASLLASVKVRRRADARPADSSIDTSSRLCVRLPSARISRDPAGIREATSSRRLRVRVVQQQSDRLDAW
jgi:hypothetical protein